MLDPALKLFNDPNSHALPSGQTGSLPAVAAACSKPQWALEYGRGAGWAPAKRCRRETSHSGSNELLDQLRPSLV